MTDRFTEDKEPRWHQKAYAAGIRARKDGLSLFDAPRLDVCGKWYRQSWIAGWTDEDQIQLAESGE